MKIGTRQIDHIVYCVHDLAAAVEQFSTEYGITPVIGGQHLHQGTHNALINLGGECYLEILAIDVSNKKVTRNRWMGIDHLGQPKITRWSLRSNNLSKDIKAIEKVKPELGSISVGQRRTPAGRLLKWNMSLPLSSPEVELLPFLLDWSESDIHPTHGLEQNCELIGMELQHLAPESLTECYAELGIGIEVQQAETPVIRATFKGPRGEFVL